jgi:hypothetical protein
MKISFDKEFEIIPVFADNDKDDNPIVAKFRYLTSPEREECIKKDYIATEEGMQRVTKFDFTKIIQLSLLSLENCEVNGVKIINAKELLSCEGISGLSNELADKASSKNIKPDLKN